MNAISVGSSRWLFLHPTLLNQSSRVDSRRILVSRPSARPFPTAGMSRELSSHWSQVNSSADRSVRYLDFSSAHSVHKDALNLNRTFLFSCFVLALMPVPAP